MKTLHTIYTNFAKRVLMALALITMGVNTAWGEGIATLPVDYDFSGGINNLPVGVKHRGLGSDYAAQNSPYLLKFDGDGDYIHVQVDGAVENIIFEVKMIGGNSTSYFQLQGSSEGTSFDDIEEFTISGAQNDVITCTTSENIDDSYRYFKFVFTKGSNVGFGKLQIFEAGNKNCNVTYDFIKISGFNPGWNSTYGKRTVNYSDAIVTFESANRQTQTITNQPVTKGQPVSLVMIDGSTLSAVEWVCKQWSDKTQTITLHYSTDGGSNYTSTKITSSNFTISSDDLPEGTNAVKITFSSSNQVGITSCSIEKVCGPTETTITLNPNGGTPNVVKEYTAKETSYTLPTCPFTRTGYNFVGWATSANGDVVYIDQATINDLDGTAIDLYAQWTEKAITRYRTDCDACIPLTGFASINGTYHFFPGETITLTVTPPADDVPYTYQWQKFVEDEWEDIDGKTTNTYTKAEATIEDVGHYRCVVSANGYCDAIAEYNVKCLQLNVYYDDHTLAFTTPLEKVNATTAVKSVNLENAHYQYYFEITDGCENFYGFNGHIHSGWYENVELNAMNSSTHCGLQTTKFGTYIFTVDHSYLTDDNKLYPVVTVTYPASLQEADKVIYLDNHVLNWTHSNNADGTNKIYYRIGHETHNNKVAMNLVPGTANLYKVTTSKYENFEVWHIANNGCWSGENNSIYKTKTDDKWAATKATEFETLPVTLPIITITPTTSIGNGGEDRNSNCEFFNYDITEGMKTWNAEVIEPTNGTITVKYTHHDGTTVNNFTSGNRDLAHTCLLTITATANEGYSLASLTVNDVPFTSGNIHTLTGNAVIKATFTINSYTVTWKLDGGNWGGDASDKVVTHKFGDEIQAPEKPTYDCHEFVEWNPTYTAGMKMPANNLEFTAQWNKLSYTITFKDYDGTVLKTSTVECGETPTPPTSPTRGQDAMYEYEFAGWSPAITEVTGNQIYTATYNQTKRQYTVNWYVNGVQLHSELVAAGDEVTAPVVNPIPCGAVLAGWTDAENGVYEHEVSELHEGAQPSIVILENKTFYAVFADYVNE